MRILAISGSLRRDSHNVKLLRGAAELLPPPHELAVFERLREVPPYDEDLDRDPVPAAVAELRERIAAADAILIATPEYNGSLPGQLKNALDWASRPYPTNCLRGKPVAVIGASTGAFGAVWAQADTRRVLDRIGARVLDRELPVGQAAQVFDEERRISSAEVQTALLTLLSDLIDFAAGELSAAA